MARLDSQAPAERPRPISLGALDEALHAVDPAVLIVAPRIVRRVIKQDTGVRGIGLRVPHRKTYVIPRKRLLTIVDRVDLEIDIDTELSEQVILIARPTSEALADLSGEDLLLKFWRQLFHARVHHWLDERLANGQLTDSDIQARIRAIGQIEFEEIRAVLRQEEYLLPPRTDRTVYVEFVAVYLELRYFVPSFLRSYFPAIADFHRIDELLRRDIDGEALLAATRPAGAPDPVILAEIPLPERVIDRLDEPQPALRPARLPARKRSDQTARALTARADQVAHLGNQVRAAILRTRAAQLAKSDLGVTYREQARGELVRLTKRLQAALNFSDNEADEWVKSLHPLLDLATRGVWTSEARLLYDLQKVCVDHERGVYTLDVFGWLFTFGRRPLKRFLPGQRDVLMTKHLRAATRRLPAARLSHRARSRLAKVLSNARRRAETSLRGRFKPLIERALDKVKLLPTNPPELVARRKLVDEILDRIVDRGFLSMSDLRDGLSRNNLKLPDLASARQFVSGDQIIRADRQLAQSLDGVYRGAEVYLRFPQRLSSLAFGTSLGRVLTRFVVLPFGGAFLLLEGLTHLVNPALHAFGSPENVRFMNFYSVTVFGCFLLGLMQNQRFREQFTETALATARVVRYVGIAVPRWFLNLPVVQWIAASLPFRIFRRYVFKPLVVTGLISVVLALATHNTWSWRWGLIVFAVSSVLLNSRIGRNVDELVVDWVANAWHRLRIHVFATLYRFIMDVFQRMLEAIERLLYTVDEWLRFRAGESRLSTAIKAALGGVWFFVNYVIRFLVTLMIEPQVNPIKHFPVVTVSHKVLLPLILTIHRALQGPLGTWAWPIAVFIQFLFPGMFGFLVWELKENWRLYAANRAPNLRAVAIGHHGETMIQFLRPGFRSGTIPKLYARLRRASRKAFWTGDWKACSRHINTMHHTSHAIRRFVDRELLEVLHESRSWADRTIATGEIRLGCNRILVELYCPDLSEDSLWLTFEDHAGWLLAGVHHRGWLDNLSQQQRQTFASALAGFYKMAGVDLVREQIEANLDPQSPGYEITDQGLLVWPRPNSPKLVLRLGDWPHAADDAASESERAKWVFAATPISWRRWVVTWELDQLGDTKHQVLDELPILPV